MIDVYMHSTHNQLMAVIYLALLTVLHSC